MSIPGFTAEASFHRMDGYYQIARISFTSKAEVVPALGGCCEDCYAQVESICSGIEDPIRQANCYRLHDRDCRFCIFCGDFGF